MVGVAVVGKKEEEEAGEEGEVVEVAEGRLEGEGRARGGGGFMRRSKNV